MLWRSRLRQLQLRRILHHGPARPIARRPDLAHVVAIAVAVEDQFEPVSRLGFLHRHAVDKNMDRTLSTAERQRCRRYDPHGVVARRYHLIADSEGKRRSEIHWEG